MLVLRQVPEPHIIRRPALLLGRAFLHRDKGLLHIKTADAFQDGIRQHRHGMIPRHGIGFPGGDVPDREQSVVIIKGQHGVDHVRHPLRLGEREERMQGTEGIPE